MGKNIKPRKGDWIQTYRGIIFYPIDPRIEEIDIIDIAHSLGHMCRFTGHTKKFYSVAEHCIRVSQIATKKLKLYALLHDASEAYLTDIPRPLKKLPLFNDYLVYEKRLQNMIYKKFGLRPLSTKLQNELDYIDEMVLMTEGRDLMYDFTVWGNFGNVIPMREKIVPMSSDMAQTKYIDTLVNIIHNSEP